MVSSVVSRVSALAGSAYPASDPARSIFREPSVPKVCRPKVRLAFSGPLLLVAQQPEVILLTVRFIIQDLQSGQDLSI